ncbi:hypothetical protein HOY34_00580 [Xinfangfangia sp. D13-10-4-6]|uniref:hypothetical protein n=1 Tax=Pseudogemmobacter hezensis TaxID=2737662 RepID=UPI00155624F1|nr:hypothetical protein [Pseudogemmobacter hezensis]NPD13695.1 hypothetical protein [Pseudogemmobacter hezensis]
MGQNTFFHAPDGGADFLGWRRRGDALEVVYDDGAARHMIWRVEEEDGFEEGHLSDALEVAVGQPKVVSALYVELHKRAIAVEMIRG